MAKDAPTYGQLWISLALLPLLVACNALPVFQQSVPQGEFEIPHSALAQGQPHLDQAPACQYGYCEQEAPQSINPLAPTAEGTGWPEFGDVPSLVLKATDNPAPEATLLCQDPSPSINDQALANQLDVVDTLRADLLSCTEDLAAYKKAYLAVNHGLSSVETALLTGMMELSEQGAVITSLQMALLEREAQLLQITLEQQATIQEMVRIQAKLRSRNSRAETASLLAEVTLTIKKAQRIAHPNQEPIIERSQRLLIQANEAYQAENYDSASFLARQGISGLQSLIIQNSYSDNTGLEGQVDQLFAIPLHMRVIEHSPMRALPSKDGEIIALLEPDAQLTAIGYKGTWVKVVWNIATRTDGWVLYNSLELQMPQDEIAEAN